MHTQIGFPHPFDPEHQRHQEMTYNEHREVGWRIIGTMVMQRLAARSAFL
jgi:hypothetical protein